jgi:hypothetical protein
VFTVFLMKYSPLPRRALLLALFATATGAARAQNIGVGTLTPGEKLEVVGGNVKISTAGSRLIFPDGTSQTTAANGTGTVVVDNADSNTGTAANFLRFGSSGSGEGIGSKRNAGGNAYGLDFYTGFTNRMTVTNGGNVGIGTTAPAGGLHLTTGGAGIGSGSPGVVLNGAPNDYPMMELRGGTTAVAPYIDFAETSAVDFSTRLQSVGGTLYLSNAGAATALSVNGGATVTGSATVGNNLQITNNLAVDNASGNTGTIANALRFGGFSGEGIGSKRSTGGNQYGLDFYTGSAPRLSITGSGNVGIGTSVPNAPLQLANTTANRKLVLYESVNNDHEFLGFGINGQTLRYQVANGGDNHVFFSGSSATTSRELMRITGTGNVGIGTGGAAPRGQFDVAGTGDIYLTANPAIGGTQALSLPGMVYLAPYGSSSSGNSYVQAGVNTAGANQGIVFRTTNAGNYRDAVVFNANGTATFNYAASGPAFTVTSDRRFKQDIRPLTGALTAVLALRGVRYEWNALGIQHGGTAGASQVGLIAQELEALYPELVATDAQGYKSVNYAQLTPVLIEALKEQQQQIETLRAQNAALQTGAGADHVSLLTLQAQMARLLGEAAPATAQARK